MFDTFFEILLHTLNIVYFEGECLERLSRLPQPSNVQF